MIYKGLKLKPVWVHCNGISSKTSSCLVSYHPTNSITWRWALYWVKPRGWKIYFNIWKPDNNQGSYTLRFPIIGALSFSWQKALYI